MEKQSVQAVERRESMLYKDARPRCEGCKRFVPAYGEHECPCSNYSMQYRQIPEVLVGCEFSGIVRKAFTDKGFDAMSVDLLPSEQLGIHAQGDVRRFIHPSIKLFIAHPPCQYLAVSGARWFAERQDKQKEALGFVQELMEAPIEHICIENPVSVISSMIRKPDQIIQPWQFGHPETKATCLWLKNLPKLKPTKIVEGREGRVWKESPGEDRCQRRSRTYTGIADAMADQWGQLLREQHK